uniref:Uncharacterized protein n=1 Tax=Mycena chlorophos TaxID=658473 RepID=A0ABQ0LJ09_MYCCL|nr:predicted protein [Mycena chlorophos]
MLRRRPLGFLLFACNVLAQQTSLQSPIETSTDSVAPFIFNGLSGLLTQWPNTVHGNGHSIVPGILHPFTMLYHGRQDAKLPPSPEWLAWDPEMSFAIMVPRGGETHLATYRTMQPANIVYFDGMSAAWGDGWLDSQHMFMYGLSPKDGKTTNWWDDYGRAAKLCEWGKPRDIDAIVRMNAGFELIWCDFDSPKLQLVSHLNITPPGTPERLPFPRFPHLLGVGDEDDKDKEPPKQQPPWRGPGREPGRRPGGGRGGGPGWSPVAEIAKTGNLEWVRAASHRAASPQPHLTLFPSLMVTYYHPRLESVATERTNKSMTNHRLTSISVADAISVVEEVNDVVERFKAGDRGSGMDWTGTALGIIEYWGDRISHMHSLLLNASEPEANATASLLAIRTLAYTLLNPYMQPGIAPNASGWELFFGMPAVAGFDGTVTAWERCTRQKTDFLSHLADLRTTQEILLQETIEIVLGRLCYDFGTIFAQSSDLVEGSPVDPFVHQWRIRVEQLMQWLDWSVWLRCEDVCPRDHVCTTPVWPIAWFIGGPVPGFPGSGDTDPDRLKPRCIRMAV